MALLRRSARMHARASRLRAEGGGCEGVVDSVGNSTAPSLEAVAPPLRERRGASEGFLLETTCFEGGHDGPALSLAVDSLGGRRFVRRLTALFSQGAKVSCVSATPACAALSSRR